MAKKHKSLPVVEALEPRLLYAADPLAAVFELTNLDAPPTDGGDFALHEDLLRAKQQRDENQELRTENGQHSYSDQDLTQAQDAQLQAARLELIFADSQSGNSTSLIDDLLSQSNDKRYFEVILLDSNHNGIEHISETLRSYQDIDAVHILAPVLSDTTTPSKQTHSHAQQQVAYSSVLSWAQTLSSQGKLLIYNSEVDSAQIIGPASELEEISRLEIAAESAQEIRANAITRDNDAASRTSTTSPLRDGDLQTEDNIYKSIANDNNSALGLFFTSGVDESDPLEGVDFNDQSLRKSDLDSQVRSASISNDSADIAFDAPPNNAPVLSDGETLTGLEASSVNPFYNTGTVSDSDSGDFDGGVLTLSISNNAESTDVLSISAANNLSLDGADVQHNGIVIGTWLGGTAGDPLRITFNANAGTAEVQAVYQNLSFSATSDNPNENTRSLSTSLSDGDGGTSNTATAMVSVTGVNDAPSGGDSTREIYQNRLYTLTTDDFAFSDIDNHGLQRVWIMQLPSAGELYYRGATFGPGNWVSVADIISGDLTYAPATNALGSSYATIGFEVQDDGGTANGGENRDSTQKTLTFDVVLEPLAPTDFQLLLQGESEFQINSFGSGHQRDASVAALNNGDFVVVWQSYNQSGDASEEGVFAQRYDQTGSALGAEFQVNNYSNDAQYQPAVSALQDGGFVIAWSSTGQDGSDDGVYAQIYNSDGSVRAAEFRLNSTTALEQNTVRLAALNNGGFVATWQSEAQDGDQGAVVVRHFDATGTAQTAEQIANSTTAAAQSNARVAVLADGSYWLLWSNAASGDKDISLQRFDAAGSALGTEVTVNSYLTGDQDNAELAVLHSGEIVVVWQSTGQDGSGTGLYGQRFSAAGTSIGAEFAINSTTFGDQSRPELLALRDGGFAVSWSSNQQDLDGLGVYLQRFDAQANKLGGERQINQTTAGAQDNANLVQLADGRVLAVWDSEQIDGSGAAIVARISTLGVDENANNGQAVSRVLAVKDNNSADTFSYYLADDADGAFGIDENTGEITVADATQLNYNDNTSLDIVVRITDADNLSFDQTRTIELNAVAQSPSSADTQLSGSEDTTLPLSWDDFPLSDADSPIDDNSAIRIDSLPANGVLELFSSGAWIAVAEAQVISKADIDAGYLRFIPANNEFGDDSQGNSGLGHGFDDYALFTYSALQTNAHTIANSDAENDPLTEGTFNIPAAGWTESSGAAGYENPVALDVPDNHDQTLFTNAGGTLIQTLSAGFDNNDNYNLSVEVAQPADGTVTLEYRVELWADSTLLAYVDQNSHPATAGEFHTAVLQVDGSAFNSINNEQLQIRLSSSNTQALFDNLRLYSYERSAGISQASNSVNIDISPINDAPQAVDDGGAAYTIAADSVLTLAASGVLSNDLDTENTPLTVLAVEGDTLQLGQQISLASGALLTLNSDGSLSYDPNHAFDALAQGETAIDSFSYSISDGELSDTATVAISIEGRNDYPVIVSNGGGDSASISHPENSTLVSTVQASDVDSTDISYSISGGVDAALFVIDSDSGELRFANPPDFESASDQDSDNHYLVTVTASDAQGNTDTQSITVQVVNQAELITIDAPLSDSIDEDEDLIFSTANGNALQVDDGGDGQTTLLTQLQVQNGVLTLAQTTGITIINGANGNASMALLGSSNAINLALEGLRFSPDDNFNGITELSISSSFEHQLLANFDFRNSEINNHAIGAAPLVAELQADAAISVDASRGPVLSLGGDGDKLHIDSDFNSPANLTLAAWLNFTSSDSLGATVVSLGDDVTLRVDEGAGGVAVYFRDSVAMQSIASSVSLADGNWHHVAFSFDDDNNTQTLFIDGQVAATASYVESLHYRNIHPSTSLGAPVDNALLGYDFSGLIDDFRLYDRALPQSEIYSLAQQQQQASEQIAIAVNAINDAPIATGNTIIASEDETLHIDITDFYFDDVESDDLVSVTISELDLNGGILTHSGGTVSVSEGMTLSAAELADLAFTPAPDQSTGASFNYSVNDSEVGTVKARMQIDINRFNDAPKIISGGGADEVLVQMDENSQAVTTVLASDEESSDQLVYGIAGGADAALFNISSSGELHFISAPNFEQPQDASANNIYHVDVFAQDPEGARDSQHIDIIVNDRNDQPANIQLSNNRIEMQVDTHSAEIGLLSGEDEDANDQLSFSLVGDVTSDSLFSIQDGVLILDYQALDVQTLHKLSVVVRATDTLGAYVDQSFSVFALPANVPLIEESESQSSTATLSSTTSFLVGGTMPQAEVIKSADQRQPLAVDEAESSHSHVSATKKASFSPEELIVLASELNFYEHEDPDGIPDHEIAVPLKMIDLASLELNQLELPRSAALKLADNPQQSLAREIQRMNEDLNATIAREETQQKFYADITAGITVTLTAGFVSWVFKSGSLVASLLSSAPAWRQIDPLPLLTASKRKQQAPEESDEESEEEKRIAALFD